MRLLAWDTSSKAGTIVALEWDPKSRDGWAGVKLIGEMALSVDATHSEKLLWGIDQLLQSANWKISDVDVFAVGVGPGSFTGLRIGVTTARTLAHTLNKPLIGISSLAALSRPVSQWLAELSAPPARSAVGRTIVIAATDACKGELFALWGSAKSAKDCVTMATGDTPGLWKRGVEEQVVTPEFLVQSVKKKLVQDKKEAFWLVVGEGRSRYPEIWKKLPVSREIRPSYPFSDHVQGRFLGQLAWEAYQAGLGREALDVHPRYLRVSDAELKLKAGLLPPSATGAPPS